MRRSRPRRRSAALAVVAATLAATGAAGAAVPAAGSARTPAVSGPAPVAARPAQLTRLRCHSTLDPTLRRVSIVSVMRHVTGTRALGMRFSLLETAPGAATQLVSDGDLGRWLSPADPTLGRRPADVWKLAKVVIGVPAPAHYRFRVQYRWLGQGGRVLRETTLTSGACGERELRPDLAVEDVRVHRIAAAPHRERYVVIIANRGLTATGPFSVLFAPGAAGRRQTVTQPSLAPHSTVRVTFIGPRCDATSPPTVVADPGDHVDDDDRANNTLTVTCPAAAALGASARAK